MTKSCLLSAAIGMSALMLSAGGLHAGSGSGEPVCFKTGALAYQPGSLVFEQSEDSKQTLDFEEVSRTTLSTRSEICITKDGNRFPSFVEYSVVTVAFEPPWDPGRTIQVPFLCEAASDGFPNTPAIDTTCVSTHATVQSIRDTSLATRYFVDGKPVDKLPE